MDPHPLCLLLCDLLLQVGLQPRPLLRLGRRHLLLAFPEAEHAVRADVTAALRCRATGSRCGGGI